MARTKKPRSKAYHPRPVSIPMMSTTRDSLALELHLATEALIAAPSVETYNQLSKMLAALRRAGSTAACVDHASDAMLAICERYERVEKIGVSAAEAAILRQTAGGLDHQIGTMPMNRFRQSIADVSAFCVDIGA